MQVIWWEKSVEYQFVVNCFNEGVFSLLAPLDGTEEAAVGDAIFLKDSRFYLIEFKKDRNSLKSEYKKYMDNSGKNDGTETFKNAANDLKKYSNEGFHIFIYGVEAFQEKKKQDHWELKLMAADYFTMVDRDESIKDVLGKGVSKDQFMEYIGKLSGLRGYSAEEQTDTGTGSGSGSMVLGISNKMRVATIIPLSKFQPTIEFKKKRSPK